MGLGGGGDGDIGRIDGLKGSSYKHKEGQPSCSVDGLEEATFHVPKSCPCAPQDPLGSPGTVPMSGPCP